MGEQITAISVQVAHHKQFLRVRRQNVLIQSVAFIDAWDVASKLQRNSVTVHIAMTDPFYVKKWIRDILYDDFQNHTTVELRQLASKYRIKNYSRMDKNALIHTLIQEGIEDGSKRREGVDPDTVSGDAAAVAVGRLPETSS